VNHGSVLSDEAVHQPAIEHRSANAAYSFMLELGAVECAVRAAQIVEDRDAVSRGGKAVCQIAPEETCPTGDEELPQSLQVWGRPFADLGERVARRHAVPTVHATHCPNCRHKH